MMNFSDFASLPESWDYLRNTSLPVFIYGMGDGCLKLLREFARRGIPVAGIFASDEFVRGHDFAGYRVHRLSEIESALDGDFVIAVAFAAGYPALREKLDGIAARHKLLFPATPVVYEDDFTVFDRAYLQKNFDSVIRLNELLADEQSRCVLQNVLAFQMTGEISYLRAVFTTPEEAYHDIIQPSQNEIYGDFGAYTGDTIAEFLHFAGGYRQIHAMEPNERNFRKLTAAYGDRPAIFLHQAAAWQENTLLHFSKGGGRQAKITASGKTVAVPAKKPDDLLPNGATYLKYDVEGAERQALAGSARTIARYAPKLCVSLYHRTEDLLELPLLIHNMNPSYRLYLRQYPYYPAWDLNLFAIR